MPYGLTANLPQDYGMPWRYPSWRLDPGLFQGLLCATLAGMWAVYAVGARSLAQHDAEGRTVLVASHDLGLVKRMKRRVLVLDHGQLVDDISPEDLADE